MATGVPFGKPSPDLVVVGGGVIGLSIAFAAQRAGLAVLVIDAAVPGAASRVAAGLLAPSLGVLPPKAAAAFRQANAGYAAFLDGIRGTSGHEALTAGRGILEIAVDAEGIQSLNEAMDPAATPFTSRDVARVAPDLAAVAGAVLHPNDGWVEPRALLGALAAAIGPGSVIRGRVAGVQTGSDLSVVMESGDRLPCANVAIAAGCWSPLIQGLETRLPITPARGEVIAIETSHSLPFAIATGDGYVVPRPEGIVVGSTYELVGYDASTTTGATEHLSQVASGVVPGAFARASSTRSWAGLRPMTPDKLPIIDVDPRDGRVVFACGHGKNGLLLAGLTGEIIVGLLGGNRLEPDSPFRLGRFEEA